MICSVATKTTGLSQGKHEVIELSIKPLGQEEISYRVRPTNVEIYDPKAQEMNGISATAALAFPDKEEVAKSILSQFKQIIPIGHNFKFDFDMIRNTFGDKFMIEFFHPTKRFDTMVLAEMEDIKRLERGQLKLFGSKALVKVCSVLEITGKTKVEKIEKVYKRLVDGN